jgi:hypothetical protein
MPVFLISYDLVNEDSSHDYKPLWAQLRKLGAVKTQLSAWYANLGNTAQEVLDHFKTYIDEDDRLMVIEVTKKPAWNIGLKGTNAFIAMPSSRSTSPKSSRLYPGLLGTVTDSIDIHRDSKELR